VRVRLAGGAVLATAVPAGGLVAGTEVDVGLRPEHVRLAGPGEEGLAAQVELVERLGDLFGQAQLLTGGGPGGASRTIVLYIFEVSFGRRELGYATAIAELLFGMIIALTRL